jgi:predicted molibdopterin-dependent oxidoreductase YjgC
MNVISLTIDGKAIQVSPRATVLDAARQLGTDIPTLCEEPGLESRAQCRLCIVEIEGRPRLEPACATRVWEGMVVFTSSDKALAGRRAVLELLLSEHPRNCPARERGLECKLCDYADLFGISKPAFGYGEPGVESRENSLMSRDAASCILCSKCIRVCEQVQAIGAVGFTGRGNRTQAGPGAGKSLEQTDCEMCGNCTAVCPTGAIRGSGVSGLAKARKVRTTCSYCGVGCQFDLNVVDDRVVGVTSSPENPVNGKWLCVKGRFGHDFIHHPDRLTTPLIRRGGKLEPATWDEALGLVASRLAEIKAANGPDAIGLMSSSRCTNEENYLMGKLARAVIGTNSVDQCART